MINLGRIFLWLKKWKRCLHTSINIIFRMKIQLNMYTDESASSVISAFFTIKIIFRKFTLLAEASFPLSKPSLFGPRAQVSFPHAHQFSEYNRKEACASWVQKYMLFAGREVHIGKNCAIGLA